MQITLEELIEHVKEAHISAYGIGWRDGYVDGKASANNTQHPKNNNSKDALEYHIESLRELYDK